MIKKWQNFLESNENVEFPLKKYTSLVRDRILNNLDEGDNLIKFDFKNNEYSKSTEIILTINWIKNIHNSIEAKTDILSALQCEFSSFNIYVNIQNNIIDYDYLISTIQHELKHVYDVLYDESEDNTFLKVEPINKLKNEFKNTDNFYEFIHLVYECLKHELDARNLSIYDRFRWLGIYDKSLIENEFKKTYTYKSLIRLGNFNCENFISNFTKDVLIKITNRFIELYGGFNKINNYNDLVNFYKFWEAEFKSNSKNYLNKAEGVIDELIKDIRPYMEGILNTKHISFLKECEFKKIFIEKLRKYENKTL